MAKNIQQQGGAIPSVRPGKPTAITSSESTTA
jgi:preprotein translocase subunit SecY